MTKPQIGLATDLRRADREIVSLRTLNLIFLADEDQADSSGNDYYQTTSKQTI